MEQSKENLTGELSDENKEKIEQLNTELSKIFSSLKDESLRSNPDERNKLVEEGNNLLLSAIHLGPDINGVTVIFNPSFDPNSEELETFFSKFPLDTTGQIPLLYEQSSQPSKQFEVILPLPYLIRSDTHGSADREAAMASLDTIHFTLISPKNDLRPISQIAGLALQIEDTNLRHSNLPIEWVDKITVGHTENYSPIYLRGEGKFTSRMTPQEYSNRYKNVLERLPELREK